MNRFLQPHNHYRLTVLLAVLWAGLMLPFTAIQAIDITVEPRVTTGVMNYQYKEIYPPDKGETVTWKDTSPFAGVGSTISTQINVCERLFLDGYGQFTVVGDDRDISQTTYEKPGTTPPEIRIRTKDVTVDFSRRDWVGTVGCVIPQKIFLDGSIILTAGYKGGKSEINGTHRQSALDTVLSGTSLFTSSTDREDSTITKTDGFFGGVSLSWPIRSTWQFQINLAYAWLDSEFSSHYHSIIPPKPTTGTTGGITGGFRIQNTLTRHITWGISVDYVQYDMDADPSNTGDPLEKVQERLIPLRASLIWRF